MYAMKFCSGRDGSILLYLNEGADFCFVSDGTAVEVYEFGLKDTNVFSESYIRSNGHL